MLKLFAPYLETVWGPFRLLGSHLVLMSLGTLVGGLLCWTLIWRWRVCLPLDRGRAHTPAATAAMGKPTGAGYLMALVLLPVFFVVVPLSFKMMAAMDCLMLAMFTGFLDDRSHLPWGEFRKGLLDLVVAGLAALVLCEGHSVKLWLPLVKGVFIVSPWLYLPLATVLLWFSINATNCSDGVDGLAGSLTLASLFALGGVLYGVIGHAGIAAHLLVPHNPEGATWAVLLFTAAGGLAGYLWHNAEPSRMLMGDAGSRYLGLLVGMAVLATGNPFLILVVAPVVLLNGGAGLVKLALLRGLRRLGTGTALIAPAPGKAGIARAPSMMIHLLGKLQFPLHDHCRKKLGWSNAQVLMRFLLLQIFLTPLLLVLLLKVR